MIYDVKIAEQATATTSGCFSFERKKVG